MLTPSRRAWCETVRSLQAGGADDAEVVLLPDGPDAALAAALTTEPTLASLPQWGTTEPLGPPACFNRLASAATRRWWCSSRAARCSGRAACRCWWRRSPSRGGGWPVPPPTARGTSRAVFSGAGPSDVARTAALARRRFGAAARSLEPLHSLADFCLAVGRPVIEAIGGADEEYGTRALLGDGLQHPGRPGRLPRRVGGRRLRLPPPAYRAAPRRRSPADGARPPPVPGPFLRPAAEPAASRLRGPLPG